MDKYKVVTKALKDRGLPLTQERCHVPADLLTVFRTAVQRKDVYIHKILPQPHYNIDPSMNSPYPFSIMFHNYAEWESVQYRHLGKRM